MGEKIEYFGKTDLIYLVNLINTEFAKYVKAVEGKGLSEEDFTAEFKKKLEDMNPDEMINVQPDWNQTDTEKDDFIKNKPDMTKYAPVNNAALTGAPTAPDADKTDGTATRIATSGYVTRTIADAIKDITGIKFEKYASFNDLPTIGKNGVIYLVPKTSAGTTNIYTEYYWVAGENPQLHLESAGFYEKLGDTTIDLSNYVTFDDIVEMATSEVQAAWDAKFPTA